MPDCFARELRIHVSILLRMAAWIAVVPVMGGLQNLPSAAQAAQGSVTSREPSKIMATDANPAFDVASIKPASPSAQRPGRLTRIDGIIGTSPGLLSARSATLKELIEGAYSLENYQVTGGPEWVDSVRFEVQGKLAGTAGRQQLLLMLRPLLTDRFKLAFHRDTKELQVYALVVAKGAKLKLYQGAEGAPLGMNRLGRNVTMASFASYLAHLGNDLPVIDKTGLTGNYDLDLDMEKIIAAAAADAGGEPPSIGSMFQATVDAMENLGLRLVRTKAPVEVLVIDHAERPSPN